MVEFNTSLSDTDYAKLMWIYDYETLEPVCENKKCFVEIQTASETDSE